MPLFYQHNINHDARLAVWHITEQEEFFLRKVPLQSEITHWHKRLQHLAGRYLLQELYADFPYDLIEIADTRKPFLAGEKYHFSISHCGDFAAAIASKSSRVGIDLELVKSKIERVKQKFLTEDELQLAGECNSSLLTLLWSCKEAVFKWDGNGEVDFKKHIRIQKIEGGNEGIVDCLFAKRNETHLRINFKFFDDMALAWVIKET